MVTTYLCLSLPGSTPNKTDITTDQKVSLTQTVGVKKL